MSYELFVGLAVGGAGLYGIKKVVQQRRLAAAAQKIKDEEEVGAKKAADTLLASTFYSDLDSLRKQLEGEIILPTDGEKYHKCRRRAFNQNQRGFPCTVVRVRSTNDVVKCVMFVNKHRKEINLCVASGCHSSKCMMNGAFVIDLVHMNKAELDKEKLIVRVQGGAYLEEIDKVLQPHNLGVPVGTYPQTGVGGLVLGGGYGFLSRLFGFSVDNFLEAEVVLSSGEVIIANNQQNSDLMWGLRGGSGNFGIVTRFTFRVYKLPSNCLSGIIAHLTPTQASAATVCSTFDKLVSTMPDNMSGMLVFPGGAPVTPTMWAYFGEAKTTGEVPVLKQAASMGGWITIQNNVKLSSYHNELQRITTPLVMSGQLYHSLIQFGELGKEMPVELWDRLLTHTRAKLHVSLVKAILPVFVMGGKMSTNDPDGTQTCLSHSARRSRFFGIIEVYWKPEFGEEGKNAARDWARKVIEILTPYSNEALRYAAADNSVGTADVIEKEQMDYGSDKFPKLRALKKKYDPTNLFKNNVNIAPAE